MTRTVSSNDAEWSICNNAVRTDMETSLLVRNLSKSYRLWNDPKDRLKQPVRSFLSRWLPLDDKCYFKEYWALKDISLDVKKGETVGIIGVNGSGKSTLLQVLCGAVAPTCGTCRTVGRVSALLELGSGFNPEFTGRENVYMNAAILGLSRAEIDERYQSIVKFADVGAFIDQPVKTYSSGMYMRLAFAVAISVEPDILLVDEALAVGDVKFQAKCFRKFEEIVAKGTSILFVTHSIEEITRRCTRAVLLDKGRIVINGHPRDVVNRYMELMFGTTKSEIGSQENAPSQDLEILRLSSGLGAQKFEDRNGYNKHEFRWGNRLAEITDFTVCAGSSGHETVIKTGLKTFVVITVEFHTFVAVPIYGLTIKTPDGVVVYGCNSRDCNGGPLSRPAHSGESVRVAMILDQKLGAGDYLLSVGVAEDVSGSIVPLDRRYDSIHIKVENSASRSTGLAEFDMTVELIG